MQLVRRLGHGQAGMSLTLLVVTIPVLMSILGLVVDAGLYGLAVVRLSSAADAAALAAASAVDFPHYQATGEIRIVEDRARAKAQTYAVANYDGTLTSTLTMLSPRKVRVDLRVTHQTVFLKLFSIDQVNLEAGSDAQVG